MRPTRKSVTTEVEVDFEAYEFSTEEWDDLVMDSKRIVRLCNLVEQEFDRKTIAKIAQRMVDTLEGER